MLLHAPGERHLLALLGAHGRRQLQLGEIRLDSHHPRAGAHGADVQHEHLRLAQLGHLALLLAPLRPHAQQSAEEEEVNLQLGEDAGKLANLAEHLPDEPIRSRQRGIDRGTHADQTTGYRVL